jgi:hypothetical protein
MIPQSGVENHNMGERRSLFKNYLPLFEMYFQPVAVKKIQFVFLQKIEEYIFAKTVFAIQAFKVVHEIWHRFSAV